MGKLQAVEQVARPCAHLLRLAGLKLRAFLRCRLGGRFLDNDSAEVGDEPHLKIVAVGDDLPIGYELRLFVHRLRVVDDVPAG